MAFDGRVKFNPTAFGGNLLNKVSSTAEGNISLPDIINLNPDIPVGYRERELISWRVPGLGYIEMYINPQSINVSEKKVIQKQRTKGGYVIQYWGEELSIIKIDGNTGTSGIEGINILRQIYRSEQDAFKLVSQKLADRLRDLTGDSSPSNMVGENNENAVGGENDSNVRKVLGGSENQTLLPTLGSLAVSVEMFYQGWIFKGYFEDFNTTESTQNGVGLITYSMTFIVLERRGFRTNFMPWHRSPAYATSSIENPYKYRNADSNTTPLNYRGEI